MAKTLFSICCAILLLTSCTTAYQRSAISDIPETILLSGIDLFDKPVTADELPDEDVLALDDEMRAYAHAKVGDLPQPGARLRALLKGMIEDGLLDLDYEPNLTSTARETFHRRQGNCLSFSNLFVALAREVDLDVSFQMVDIPPAWLHSGEMMMLNNHINILIKGIRYGARYRRDHVVDFNSEEFNGNYATRVVGDEYAFALYYSNKAVEAMQRADNRSALIYLTKGINAKADIAGLWVNLGALYSSNGLYNHAQAAYHKALSIKPSNKSALVNLARLHKHLGNTELAEYYDKRVHYYLLRNPYYHYFLAKKAYGEEKYAQAIAELKLAFKLKDDEHQFYYLRGLIYFKTGEPSLARKSIATASDYAIYEKLKKTYMRKIAAIDDIRD